MVGFIIGFYQWWRNKHAMFQTYVTAGNQKPVHTNGQDSKEPEYMEICSAKQTENVATQDNPAYSFDHQDKLAISKETRS